MNSPCICGQKSKAGLECGICKSALCKSCAQFVEEETFSFLKEIPEDLSHSVYCSDCYAEKVAPALSNYQQWIEQAKEIFVYKKSQSKETRLLKRLADPIHVHQCADFDETLLRMAFFAVQAGYNAIIDVEIKSEKVRSHSYQTTVWTGTCIPTHLNEDRLIRDRSSWQNPN